MCHNQVRRRNIDRNHAMRDDVVMTFNEKIETDIAYIQNQFMHLDDVVTELQKRVSKLEKQNEFLKGKLDEIAEERPARKPPHY